MHAESARIIEGNPISDPILNAEVTDAGGAKPEDTEVDGDLRAPSLRALGVLQ